VTNAAQPFTIGPVLAFAASPAFDRDGTAFATGEGGLLRTIDHGTTWTPIRPNPLSDEAIPVTAVAVAPSFGRGGVVFTAIPGGIGQSPDVGDSWQFTALPLPPPLVSSLALSPAFAEDGTAFAGTIEDGIFRTEDYGRSWLPWNFGLYDHSVLAMAVSPHFSRDGMVFAGTSSGLYRSTNRGRSWRPIATEIDCPAILSLAVIPADTGEVALYAGAEEGGLLRLNQSDAVLERIDDAALPETVQALACNSTGAPAGLLLVFGEDRAASSTDGGATWVPLGNDPLGIEGITAVSPPLESNDGPVIFTGTSDGQIHRIALNGVHP
jgi:photosystem II stability/assembly factor-like uncharacterized protein